MMPVVVGLSLAAHGMVLALVAVLPPPTYAAAPNAAELEFHVLEPVVEPEPEPVVEPEPEPVVEPEPVRRERAEPPPEAAPPPPAPIMTAGEAGPGDDFVMPPGEEGGQLGGTPGGTGDTVGAEPVEPAVLPEPQPRGMSRAELRRRLVSYIRTTLHGYVAQRVSMPLVARREHLEGTVIVRIRLARDGRVLGARLSRSSGHDVLDEAAVASISALTSVPAPPEDIPWDPDEELPLPVRYQVR